MKPKELHKRIRKQLLDLYANPPENSLLLPLDKGLFSLVDKEDLALLNHYKWHAWKTKSASGYFARRWHEPQDKTEQLHVFMHRQIMEAPDDMRVVHMNSIGLDNRKENLRLVKGYSKILARSVDKGGYGLSRYRGVTYNNSHGLWYAKVKVDDKVILIGHYKTEEEAALAYNAGAFKYFGEFATLNQVPGYEGEDLIKEPIRKSWGESAFRGVQSNGNKWIAVLQHKNQIYRLGIFTNPEDAARAYDKKAAQLRLPRWRFNFPDEHS